MLDEGGRSRLAERLRVTRTVLGEEEVAFLAGFGARDLERPRFAVGVDGTRRIEGVLSTSGAGSSSESPSTTTSMSTAPSTGKGSSSSEVSASGSLGRFRFFRRLVHFFWRCWH